MSHPRGLPPAASLKRELDDFNESALKKGIRGVCPRGLIEATCRHDAPRVSNGHPRGLPPRPH